MAIVPLDKLTVYGKSEQSMSVLHGLQAMGCLHLVDLRDARTDQPPELVSKEAREALRYLDACPIHRRQSVRRSKYERDRLIQEVLSIKNRQQRLQSELDYSRKAVADLKPWGNFSLPSSDELGGTEFWFYIIPLNELSELPDTLNWHIAHKDNRFAYVVILAEHAPEDLPFQSLELDRRPRSKLLERIDAIEEELDELHWQRVTLTRWRNTLKNDLDTADDKAAQLAASHGMLDDATVFAVQGWVPRMAIDDVRRFARTHHLAITIEPASDEDHPPTLLKNPKRVAGAEDCVQFYITPGYHTWDPTTIVFFSFSLFFGMIVSDAGYGLVMAGLLLFFWRKLSGSASGIRFRNLLTGIVTATIVYGVLVGSYFGLEPRPDSLLDTIRIRIDGQPMMSNQTAMMVISVAIGVGHLVLANSISAWQRRDSARCLGHLGWASAMLGAFLIGCATLFDLPVLAQAGKACVIVGALAVLLFSSDRPFKTRSVKTHLYRLVDGGMQFANVSKAFGDVLSYLRLFALGLASAQLAVTFNGLASGASESGGIGILLALLILVVGHGINFLLALLGGVVHGLRLNCIEFFNWSLTEEGYSFQPFRKKADT